MAIENSHVTADVIEATEFPELAQQYGVRAVPKIIINDRVQFEGAVPEQMFLQAVLQALNGQAGSPQGGPTTSR